MQERRNARWRVIPEEAGGIQGRGHGPLAVGMEASELRWEGLARVSPEAPRMGVSHTGRRKSKS